MNKIAQFPSYPFGNNIRDIFQRESVIDMRRNQPHFSTSKRTKLFIREQKICWSFSNWGVSINADKSNRIAAKGRMPWMVAITHHFYVLILIPFFSLLFQAEIVQTTFIKIKIKSSYFSSQKNNNKKRQTPCGFGRNKSRSLRSSKHFYCEITVIWIWNMCLAFKQICRALWGQSKWSRKMRNSRLPQGAHNERMNKPCLYMCAIVFLKDKRNEVSLACIYSTESDSCVVAWLSTLADGSCWLCPNAGSRSLYEMSTNTESYYLLEQWKRSSMNRDAWIE